MSKHYVTMVSDDAEYGGLKMACTCGWESRVIGISDNFQFSNLKQLGREHEQAAADEAHARGIYGAFEAPRKGLNKE